VKRVQGQFWIPAWAAPALRPLLRNRFERERLIAHAAIVARETASRPEAVLAEFERIRRRWGLRERGRRRLRIRLPPALRDALDQAAERGFPPWIIWVVAALRAVGADYPEEVSAEAPKPSKPRPAGTYDIGEDTRVGGRGRG
jgi:hypothetical protein